MKLRNLSVRLILATTLATTALSPALLRAQGGDAPQQASNAALQLFNNGSYKEAAEAYEKVIQDYPTSVVISDAHFRVGYLSFILGDYDKSLEHLRKILGPPAPAEIQELAQSVIPQSLAAKAAQEEDEAKRKAAYQEAIKQYDLFLSKYPKSDQVESATYGRSLAQLQIEEYGEAAKGLRSNLQHFPKSETILDTQYLLALVLATQGSLGLQADAASAAAAAQCDEAQKLLTDIITKRTDIALLNDAQFQIAELLFNRGAFAKDQAQRDFWAKAIEAYRAVQPKEPMIKAQEARLKGVVTRKLEAGRARNVPEFKRLERLQEKEASKLEAVKAKSDLTISAKSKVAQIYFQQKEFDEARTLLRAIQPFAEDGDQQKTILYYVALTYASQGMRDQAVAAYDQFQKAFKADPMADNLPLMIGTLFLSATPPDPQKAIEYFKEGSELYPKGRFIAETSLQRAQALLQLRRFDEALKVFQDFLATKPRPELAAQTAFGIANVYKETGKVDEAIAGFKKVRDEYKGTVFAEQSAFWVGQLYRLKGDNVTAVAELGTFLKDFPKSELFPTAKFFLAEAELGRGDSAKAMTLFGEVGSEFPDSEVAPHTYFRRASIVAKDGKADEMVAILREFIEKFPDDGNIYFAYDSIGKNQISGGQLLDAVETYKQMVDKHADNPRAADALLQLTQLWRQYAESQGRYLALNEEQRAAWNKGIAQSLEMAEKLIADHPESPQVALVLKEVLSDQKLLQSAKVKTADDVTKYFQDLAAKFEEHPSAQSKILFTLASFTYEGDKEKALAQMKEAYRPELLYAADDMDLYGSALLDGGDVEASAEVYAKLANDYPNPPGVEPNKASAPVQEAQSIALYGQGRALQKQGKVAEAGALFDQLKKLYPWSPKLLEANFGIAEAAFNDKKLDDSAALLIQIIRANTASVDLRARASLLMGAIQEAKGDVASAIDQYIKIAAFFGAANEPASEGLWKGGQLLEKQAATLPATAAKDGEPTKPGQLRKALRAYRNLVDQYPNSPHVAAAEGRIKALEAAGVK
ncbi:MAG TPA: tetratricopeptide repeat protein [Chthoniobacteraceae bacterium]|nr:tetratricopeptide repeat protein [Chthoniobacteraceae bacterium]